MGGTAVCWEAGDSEADNRRRAGATRRGTSGRRLILLVSCSDTEGDSLLRDVAGHGVEVHRCTELAVALMLIGTMQPDLVIVGETQGPLDAVHFLHAVRAEDTGLPVIIGVSDGDVSVGSGALAAGATALVRRPFSPGDLRRLIRSVDPAGDALPTRPSPLLRGRLRIDGAAPRIWVDDVEMLVPPMEFLLLRYLANRVGEVLTRSELLTAVWGGSEVPSNTLNVHLARIRRRLSSGSGEDWIRPIRGIGYQFLIPEPRTGGSAPQAPGNP